MARRCKTSEFSRILEIAREASPLFNVTTDLIVGFPGETEDEWQQTMDYVGNTGFGHMHIFSFSPREGTAAARFPDQINKETKKERSRQMHELASRLKTTELEKNIGQTVPVLWEQKINAETGLWSGYTPQYHKVVSSDSCIQEASISDVTIDLVSADGLTLVSGSSPIQGQKVIQSFF
jgi:threonylcarbamoyladenosine tRNA methylthiotransferase MtaB